MSLRAKLILLVVALTTVLLGGLGVYLAGSLGNWSEQAVDAELERRAGRIAAEVEWEHGRLELEDDHRERLSDWPFRIESGEGEVLYTARWNDAWTVGGGQRLATLQEPGGRRLRVLTAPFTPRKGRGPALVLRVAAPISAFAPLAERFRGGLLIAVPLVVLLGALGAAGIAQLFLSPVRRLAREAAALDGETQGQRLDVRGLDPELRRLAERFNQALQRLEASVDAQRAFVGRASHALRTPLAGLLSTAEVTLRQPRDADAYRKALEDVAAAAREASALADGVLALSRAETQDAPRRPTRVAGAELARDVARLFGPRAEQAGLTLRTTSEDVSFEADRDRVREMLDALVDNALRYTPRGGTVAFRARRSGDGVVLEVEDTGPGLAPDERDRVTDRFFRGRAAEGAGVPGSGLGLAVVAALARREQARLDLGDAPGGGTRAALHFDGRAGTARAPAEES